MNRISSTFENLRSTGSKGFIPFISAGDPDLETSLQIALTLAQNGADILELGVPFSDPMADGPTIQASSQRALINGTKLMDVLELVKQIRKQTEVAIVLFSYLNPLFNYGLRQLSIDLADAGGDGILVTDVVDDEAEEIASILNEKNLDLISLIAPTTSEIRLEKIADRSRGFIYAVSRAGVTGAREKTSFEAEKLVTRIRKYTKLPVAVGFGISTRDQIEDVWRYADAAIVGSAIVREVEMSRSGENAAERVRRFITELLPEVAKRRIEI